MSDFLPVDPHHRSQEVVADLIASLKDHSSRIVPVDLGMFGKIRHQVPWMFNSEFGTDGTDPHAMLWDEEAGDFEPAVPSQRTAAADDGEDVLEFLEDVGAWVRAKR